MKAAYVIAVNTFRETIRNHALYTILGFVALVLLLSISFGEWSVFSRVQVMQDFGLAAMSISSLLLAVFVGVGMLGREMSTKTVYMLAARPVSRSAILMGKFSGLMITLMVNFAAMSVFFFITLALAGGGPHGEIAPAIGLLWAEMALVVAAALFFSTFSSDMLSALFTLGFYIAGHFNDLFDIAALSGGFKPLAPIVRVLYYLLPNLGHFDIRSRVVYGQGVSEAYLAYAVLYGALFVGLFLTLACIIFERRDL
jgi:ABC-type transport system involved in multi-copper enzyme maturation permease subunit